MALKIKEILPWLDTEYFGEYILTEQDFLGFSMDSRTLERGDIFIAINSGNRYIPEAIKKGARCVISDRSDMPEHTQAIIVKDIRRAILGLAKFWRRAHKDCKRIGVTGSCGKTTTTQMIAHLLARKYIVHATCGNHNNHFGVPETIFGINNDTEVAVVEVGISEPGEMLPLALALDPNISVVTTIAPAHMEFFRNLDEIKHEKAKLITFAAEGHRPMAVLNGDSLECLAIYRDLGEYHDRWFFGMSNKNAPVYATNITRGDDWTAFEVIRSSPFGRNIPTESFVLQFECQMTDYNIMNALAAIAVARHLEVEWHIIQKQFLTFEFPEKRFEIKQIKGVTVINDAYNANPESMQAAIRASRDLCQGKLILVLGDMLELGWSSRSYHETVGWLVGKVEADAVLTIGLEMHFAFEKINGKTVEAGYMEKLDIQKVIDFLRAVVREGDTVLFKASNSMQLDKACAQYCHYLREKGLN